jgi:recombination protein RecA
MADKWMSKLCRDFGVLAADTKAPSENVFKLASPSFNWAVGNRGISEGKVACLFGPESGGKSLLMQLMIIEIQKKYPESYQILFDAEYSFNKIWFAQLGGNVDKLIVRQSNDPVKIFDYIYGEMLELLQEGCPIKALAIDSVKSIKYPKDIKKKSTDLTMGGGGASYLGSTWKSVLPVIKEYSVSTILVQQVYEEMDQYKKMRNPWIVPDGRALKHACDYMLQVEKLETKAGIVEVGSNIMGGKQQVAHKVRIKGKKNRVGAPYRVAEFTLSYTDGIINVAEELFELAKSLEIIYHPISETTGKVNTQMWQFANYDPIRGEANIKQWVADNPQHHEEMFDACCGVNDDKVKARNEDMEITADDLINLE